MVEFLVCQKMKVADFTVQSKASKYFLYINSFFHKICSLFANYPSKIQTQILKKFKTRTQAIESNEIIWQLPIKQQLIQNIILAFVAVYPSKR